jgi:hypothetical protein
MSATILALRVNRRAIGVALLTRDGLRWADGRHLASGATRAIPAAMRYVERLLIGSGINAVIIDSAARGLSDVTDGVLDGITQVCLSQGLAPITIGRAIVLAAYGLPSLRSRPELRDLVADYWPDLTTIRGRVKPYAMDAAAAALYAECHIALTPRPT